jgi:hypothetical protein
VAARRSGAQRGTARLRPSLAVLAWAGATAVAVAVVWLGVDSVLLPVAGPAPAAVAVGAPGGTVATGPPPAPDRSSATAGAPTAAPSVRPPTVRSTPTDRATRRPTTAPPGSGRPTSSPGGDAHGGDGTPTRYQMPGGIVVLDIGTASATFVSATPAGGYAVQEWSAPGFIRVDFTAGDTVYSLYATWNGYPPEVQMYGPDGAIQ